MSYLGQNQAKGVFMSAQTQLSTQMSMPEYLAFEDKSAIKHEYAAGQIFAMAGASERHNRIAMNFASHLHQATRRSACTTFISDMRVKIDQVIYYPDIMVACEASDRDPYLKTAPCLIVEVLSASTERIDRGEKLYNYQQIAELKAYVLISQEQVRVDVYRHADAQWLFESYSNLSDTLHLDGPKTELTLAEIYERIEFPNTEMQLAT